MQRDILYSTQRKKAVALCFNAVADILKHIQNFITNKGSLLRLIDF